MARLGFRDPVGLVWRRMCPESVHNAENVSRHSAPRQGEEPALARRTWLGRLWRGVTRIRRPIPGALDHPPPPEPGGTFRPAAGSGVRWLWHVLTQADTP